MAEEQLSFDVMLEGVKDENFGGSARYLSNDEHNLC